MFPCRTGKSIKTCCVWQRCDFTSENKLASKLQLTSCWIHLPTFCNSSPTQNFKSIAHIIQTRGYQTKRCYDMRCSFSIGPMCAILKNHALETGPQGKISFCNVQTTIYAVYKGIVFPPILLMPFSARARRRKPWPFISPVPILWRGRSLACVGLWKYIDHFSQASFLTTMRLFFQRYYGAI